VPILSSKRWVDRRQRDVRRRADGVGREIVPQEKRRKSRKQTTDAGSYGLGTQVFLIALGAEGLARRCRAERETKAGRANGERPARQISGEARRCGYDTLEREFSVFAPQSAANAG